MSKPVVIPSRLEAVRAVEEDILAQVDRCGYDESASFAIRLALEESLNNAFKHGNRADPNKTITVSYDVTEERVEFSVRDEGSGFNPNKVPDPTADENLENPSGRGIMLMKAYMDEVCYNDQGNQVRMVKFRRRA